MQKKKVPILIRCSILNLKITYKATTLPLVITQISAFCTLREMYLFWPLPSDLQRNPIAYFRPITNVKKFIFFSSANFIGYPSNLEFHGPDHWNKAQLIIHFGLGLIFISKVASDNSQILSISYKIIHWPVEHFER